MKRLHSPPMHRYYHLYFLWCYVRLPTVCSFLMHIFAFKVACWFYTILEEQARITLGGTGRRRSCFATSNEQDLIWKCVICNHVSYLKLFLARATRESGWACWLSSPTGTEKKIIVERKQTKFSVLVNRLTFLTFCAFPLIHLATKTLAHHVVQYVLCYFYLFCCSVTSDHAWFRVCRLRVCPEFCPAAAATQPGALKLCALCFWQRSLTEWKGYLC